MASCGHPPSNLRSCGTSVCCSIGPLAIRKQRTGIGAFVQGMGELGWRIGGNLRIEYRYSAGNPELFRKYASELVALAPDVILAAGTVSVAALQQLVPFHPDRIHVASPIRWVQAFVESLARPGGNATGFMLAEYSVSREMAGTAEADCA